jgi:hypothetical protein
VDILNHREGRAENKELDTERKIKSFEPQRTQRTQRTQRKGGEKG